MIARPEAAAAADRRPRTGLGRVPAVVEAAVGLLYLALTLVYTNPLWRHPGTYLPDPGDPVHNVSVSWWLSEHLRAGRLAGFWSLPPYFYPMPTPLALGEPQIGATVLGLPVYLLTHNIVLSYNAVALISLPLCALGTYLLVRHLTRSRGAALFAGVVWGFGAWHTGQAGHQQLLSLEFLPFLLLMLHRYGETRRGRYLAGLGALWLVQEYMAEYWGAYLLLLVLPFAVLLLRFSYGLPWPLVGRACAVIAAAVAAWLPAQIPLLALAAQGYHHPAIAALIWSADLSDYLPARGTWLWGPWGTVHPHPTGEPPSGEFFISPGVVTLLLAVAGTTRLFRRDGRPDRAGDESAQVRRRWQWVERLAPGLGLTCLLLWGVMQLFGLPNLVFLGLPYAVDTGHMIGGMEVAVAAWAAARYRDLWYPHRPVVRAPATPLAPYAALALAAVVWSCGETVRWHGMPEMTGLYGYLSLLPFTHGMRVLARIGVIADLALAVLAAHAVAYGLRRLRRGTAFRAAALAALCLLAWAENVPRRGTGFAVSGAYLPPIRPADRWLAAQPPGPAVELPLTGYPKLEVWRMWRQTVHHKALMNGYSTFFRRGYLRDAKLLAAPQSAAAVTRLRQLRVHYVILDTADYLAGEEGQSLSGPVPRLPPALPAPYQLRFADATTKIYELR